MRMLRAVKKAVPQSLQAVAESAWALANDWTELLTGQRNSMVPPRRMWGLVGGCDDFHVVGQKFFQYIRELGGLQPHHAVLDVGSGIGRIAYPLTSYLSETGSYDGFDILQVGVEWCQRRITPKRPNFRFQLADVYNSKYNPTGRHKGSEFTFPYPEDSFDFVYLTSVFTHLLRADMEHYLSEIVRVMRPGGRCLMTYFLLNEESESLMRVGASSLPFDFGDAGCRIANRQVPESVVAYEEAAIRSLFQEYGLHIDEPIRYGSWCGREVYLSYQDIVLAGK